MSAGGRARTEISSALMGVANSPLRDRVVFVQGAPRSGTTWLVTLLATHPEIAGVETETHLFEFGVDRLFDNFENRDRHLRGLASYLDREELVDLVRDLCDGVLLRMRSHVRGGEDASFVVEKTPTSFHQGALDLRRKLECYPDAYYVHILRDGEAVTRSLMRSTFMRDRSYENCHRVWRESVSFTRDVLGDHPRYREITYEDLRADPGRAVAELYQWLDVDSGETVLQTARAVSKERFSELGVVQPQDEVPRGSSLRRAGRRAKRLAGAAVGRVERRVLDRAKPQVSENAALTYYFVKALRMRDREAVESLTADGLTLTYRSPVGDLVAQGDEARAALMTIADQLFADSWVSEVWAAAPGGPREWWTRGAGQQFWPLFYSGIKGDAQRADLAFGLAPEDGRIASMVVFSIGSPAGRPIRELSLQSLRSPE